MSEENRTQVQPRGTKSYPLSAYFDYDVSHNDAVAISYEEDMLKFQVISANVAQIASAVDGTSIFVDYYGVQRVQEEKCQAMILMRAIGKYFCTNCLSTIKYCDAKRHIQECFIVSPVDEYYCQVCREDNELENVSKHYNSIEHQNQMELVQHLYDSKKCYINDHGVKFLSQNEMREDVTYEVSLNFLGNRLRMSARSYNQYSNPGGKLMYQMIAVILRSCNADFEQIKKNLTYRKQIVRCMQTYRAELSGGKKLCHLPAFDNGFIVVGNCADALYEHNAQKIKLKYFNVAEREFALLQLREKFSTSQEDDGETTEYCFHCQENHEINMYDQPLDIDALAKELIRELELC